MYFKIVLQLIYTMILYKNPKMTHIFAKSGILAALILFSQVVCAPAAHALPFPIEIVSQQSSAAVTVIGISLRVTDIKNVENGEVVAIKILVENNSSKVLSTGIEDFSLGGVTATANSIQLFLIEKDRSNRIINLIPYMGMVDSIVSTPGMDVLQDVVGDSYRGGLILPSASKSGYVFFRKVKEIKNFQMYSIYDGDLLTLRIPELMKKEEVKN